jgi:hypothetical protein
MGGNRHRDRSCIKTPSGGMSCPPYGCVFPDEACDIISA